MTIQKMLRELVDAGFSQQGIATACGTTQPTIWRTLNGSTPRYELGKEIENFHKRITRAAARRAA